MVLLVADGLKNREIAERLKVKEHSIRNYLYRIFEKLGVSTQVELILYAFSHRGIITIRGGSSQFPPRQRILQGAVLLLIGIMRNQHQYGLQCDPMEDPMMEKAQIRKVLPDRPLQILLIEDNPAEVEPCFKALILTIVKI